MIARASDPDGARALARAGGDFLFVIGAEIVREEEPERAGGFVEHGAGIAAGVFGVVPHDLLRTPCATAVSRALQQQVDVAAVATGGFATLTEGEQRAVFRAD